MMKHSLHIRIKWSPSNRRQEKAAVGSVMVRESQFRSEADPPDKYNSSRSHVSRFRHLHVRESFVGCGLQNETLAAHGQA